VRTAQVISVPPPDRLIHDVSGLRASASAAADAAAGMHCTRTIQRV
jgi:hypothetical protein